MKSQFHNLINNCPGKSKNLKSQQSLCVILLFCFLFRSSPPKLFSKVAVLKFQKEIQHRCFSVNIVKFLGTRILKTSVNGCFCVPLLFDPLSFSKFIQNYYFMFSLLYYVTYFTQYMLIIKFKVQTYLNLKFKLIQLKFRT